jgi:(2Fe-2S) ferredoxin
MVTMFISNPKRVLTLCPGRMKWHQHWYQSLKPQNIFWVVSKHHKISCPMIESGIICSPNLTFVTEESTQRR